MFEILCLQEIQCGPKDTQPLYRKGYRLHALHRKISTNRRYYGGSIILIKNEIREGVKITSNSNDDRIWLKLSKKFFHFERDVFVRYAPPASSAYVKNLHYDKIFKNILGKETL